MDETGSRYISHMREGERGMEGGRQTGRQDLKEGKRGEGRSGEGRRGEGREGGGEETKGEEERR